MPITRDSQVHRPVACAVPVVQRTSGVIDADPDARGNVVHPQDGGHTHDLESFRTGRWGLGIDPGPQFCPVTRTDRDLRRPTLSTIYPALWSALERGGLP